MGRFGPLITEKSYSRVSMAAPNGPSSRIRWSMWPQVLTEVCSSWEEGRSTSATPSNNTCPSPAARPPGNFSQEVCATLPSTPAALPGSCPHAAPSSPGTATAGPITKSEPPKLPWAATTPSSSSDVAVFWNSNRTQTTGWKSQVRLRKSQ